MENKDIDNKKYVEKIFSKCGYKCMECSLDDEGQYYAINFDASDVIPGMKDLLGLVAFILEWKTCVFVLGNIYRYASENEDKILSVANNINKKINAGKVVVHNQYTNLYYTENRKFDSIEEFDCDCLKSIISSAKLALAVTYSEIKGIEDEK